MTLGRYLLVYSCISEDGDTSEELVEIQAYSMEQAYVLALNYCSKEDIISLECTIKRCGY